MENIEEVENLELELEDTQSIQKNKMLEGAFWSTIAEFVSRLLGVVYIIPWYAWMGKNGDLASALFNMSYTIYAMFLLISTAGLNVAVAKEVARFNASGDENQSYRLVRQMLIFMFGIGVIFGLVMFIFSPALANMSGGGAKAIPVMRSLAPAVLIFPSMSVIRGFFQGNNNIKPNAMSQLAEQFIRVIWMLLTAFIIMKIGSGDYVSAVTQATFAAFVGMIASYSVLIYYLQKTGSLTKIINPGPAKVSINTVDLLKSTIVQAIPFVILGSAIQIFRLIDQFTFPNFMTRIGNYTNNEVLAFFTYSTGNPDKIVMIFIAVAMSLSAVGLPLLTANYVKRDFKAAGALVRDNLLLFFAFMIPSVVGMSILAQPVYTFFYKVPSKLALSLFVYAVFLSFFMGLYGLLTPVMQGLRHSRIAMKYFGFALVLKVILQLPMIYFFESYGPLTSSLFAFVLADVLYLKKVHELIDFNINSLLRRLSGILVMTLIMAIVTSLVFVLLKLFITPNNKLKSLIMLVFAGGSGIITYFYLIMKSRMIDVLLGEKGVSLRKRFGIN